MVMFGTSDTLIQKFQDKTIVTYNGITGEYSHPFVQTCAMFLGQSMCLIIYFGKKAFEIKSENNKEKQDEISEAQNTCSTGASSQKEEKPQSFNPLWLIIPAFCDILASSLLFLALTQVAPSIYQMLRGCLIIYVAFFSTIFLK